MKIKAFLIFIFQIFTSAQLAHAGMFTWLRWTNEVRVCFANPVKNSKDNYKRTLWNQQDKEQVQRWVQDEYTPSRTGIYFVGFEDCKLHGETSQILLNYRPHNAFKFLDGERASATIGRLLVYTSKDFERMYGIAHFFSGGLNKSTVIHEFGHLAGLYHEHEHPDVKGCNISGSKKETFRHGRGYTEYDPESIMSYCVTRAHNNRGLSAGDIFTLRLMYVERINYLGEPKIFR